ncbi:MAG: SRPBCC family protein [Nannocystaceae bacterium]
MNDTQTQKQDDAELSLMVRRTIAASPERLFRAWTDPNQIVRWWGPKGTRCIAAEMDLRVGGGYRIGNSMPDGNVLWIVGSFEKIEPPTRLVYSWSLENSPERERVSVRFLARGLGKTEVIVVHKRVANRAIYESHEAGWNGCLAGLEAYIVDSKAEDTGNPNPF